MMGMAAGGSRNRAWGWQAGTAIVVVILVASSCAPEEEPTVEATQVDSAQTQIHPDSAAVARWRAQLPAEALARANACPFECCTYGEWVAEAAIPVYAQPRSAGAPLFSIRNGQKLKADSGVVFVTGIALAVVDDTVFRYPDNQPWLLPGDTLVLLDPIGEGYWTAWRRGEVLEEVPPFFEAVPEPRRGRLIGTPAREWWVHASVNGRAGWFQADSARVRGSDACS